MRKNLKKFNIFDIDFLKPFEGIPSNSLFSEFVAVFYGIKPVLRTYAIRLDKYPLLKKICKKFSLFTEYSDFRVSSRDDALISSRGPFVYLYISKCKELAREARLVENQLFSKKKDIHGKYRMVLRFSQLLGYPRCCFNFFVNYVKDYPGDIIKASLFIEYEVRRRTKGRCSSYLNNLIRGDYYLISHHPCSYNCKSSIKYAKKVLAAIKKVRPEIASRTATLLKFPVIKFLRRGYFVRFLNGRAYDNKIIIYKSCEGEESLVKKFIKGNGLEVGKNKIKIFRDRKLVDVYNKKNELDGVIFDFE